MKHKLIQNIGLKIIALIFAVVLWFVVVNIDDPVTSAVYRNIPVTITHEEVVTNQGKVYQILDEVQSVTVTVNAKRSVLSRIRSEAIIATADMTQLETNTFLIPITVTIPEMEGRYKSAEANPNNLRIKLEDVTKNNFPISVSATGTPRDGYVIGEMTTNPEKITIRGSESRVESIAKAVAKIDVSGLSESAVLDAELILYDSKGNVIDQTLLNNNLGEEALSVNVQVLSTKDVRLDFGVSGEPASGFVYTGWSSVPEVIQVCGTKQVLNNFKVLEIPASEIDISEADGNIEVTVDIQPYLPAGVSLVDETANNVIVKVFVEEIGARTIELPIESVKIKNLAEKLQVSSVEGQDLKLRFTGPEDILKELDIRNAVSVDLKNYTAAGKYDVPVTVEIAPGVTLVEIPTVKIHLAVKETEGE